MKGFPCAQDSLYSQGDQCSSNCSDCHDDSKDERAKNKEGQDCEGVSHFLFYLSLLTKFGKQEKVVKKTPEAARPVVSGDTPTSRSGRVIKVTFFFFFFFFFFVPLQCF